MSMPRTARWAGLLLVFVVPALAADKNETPATPSDYSQLATLTDLTGKLNSFDSTAKTITLEVDYQILQPNPKVNNGSNANQMNHLLQKQQQIMRQKNPIQRAIQMQHLMAQAQALQGKMAANAFIAVTEHKDFDIQGGDDAKVRLQDLPVRLDEKGNPKPYTADEKKDLKGTDTKLPGYNADWTDLKIGQIVKVTLSKHHDDAKDAKDKDDNDNKDAKDKPKAKDAPKPEASVILILKDAPDTTGGKKGK
jgi:hypothetical protein